MACDGTGLGTDGTAWGGEVLVAGYGAFERAATLRPIPLAGGDRAVREPWRTALAALDDAFGGAPPLEALPLFRTVTAREVEVVRRMIASGLNSPPAHGAGRLFDAVGALALGRGVSRYEGQVAIALDNAAGPGAWSPYPFDVDEAASPWRLDWRPLVRAAAGDVVAGRGAGEVSGRFHARPRRGHRRAGAPDGAAAREAARWSSPAAASRTPVSRRGWPASSRGEFEVYLHCHVPPGDGGLALGQALVADATAR